MPMPRRRNPDGNNRMTSATALYFTHDGFHPAGIRYGFFSRKGGVSQGLYDSLNGGLGSDDDRALVQQNRKLAAKSLGFDGENICSLYQVHSSIAITVDAPLTPSVEADALITQTPGLALMILTADCVPVIFADPTTKTVAAAHAGWRGAVGGVLEATLEAMLAKGADLHHITAVIGPAIQQPSYQVGDDVRNAALSYDSGAGACFTPDQRQSGKFYFDLTGYVGRRLDQAKITHLTLGRDTYAEPEYFFSHRRRTHQGEPDTGRLMTIIGLE
jgi:YfiH family protein